MRFEIAPYIGALPIRFGMTRAEVHGLLGEPMSSHPFWDGSGTFDAFNEASFDVGYDLSEIVNHVGISPHRVEVILNGRGFCTNKLPDPNRLLLELDPEPLEHVGFWVFPKLGITTSGFHDDDPGQRALTVFPKHRLSEWLAVATPADTSRYTNTNQ